MMNNNLKIDKLVNSFQTLTTYETNSNYCEFYKKVVNEIDTVTQDMRSYSKDIGVGDIHEKIINIHFSKYISEYEKKNQLLTVIQEWYVHIQNVAEKTELISLSPMN
jgi:hypothetical protein